MVTNCINENRIGVVTIGLDVIESMSNHEIAAFWSNLCPISIEHDYEDYALVVEACSPLFDVCETGIPAYELISNPNDTYTARRI